MVDRVAASVASLPRLGFDGSAMKRDDDRQRRARGSHLTSAIWQGTLCPKKPKKGVKMILKEPHARAA